MSGWPPKRIIMLLSKLAVGGAGQKRCESRCSIYDGAQGARRGELNGVNICSNEVVAGNIVFNQAKPRNERHNAAAALNWRCAFFVGYDLSGVKLDSPVL